MKNNITQEQIKSLLDYNEEAGVFYWKVSAANNSIKVGSVAGSLKKNGYIGIGIENKEYYAHRLAWLYVYGEFPSCQIDHINRVRSDNRLVNMRIVSNKINAQNQGLRQGSLSGFRGVNWYKKGRKWQARIHHNNKTMHVGYYDNLADAKLAREIAEIFCWGTPEGLDEQMNRAMGRGE
jgi:hypothetical protein